MSAVEDRPLYTRLLEVSVAIEAIEKGWDTRRVPDLDFYLKVVLPPLIKSLSGHAPLAGWISGPVGQLKHCLSQERQPTALRGGSQIRLFLKALKSGLVAAFLKVKYNDFCDSNGLFAALWEADEIAQLDERSLLTRNSFLHYEANEGGMKRSWSCPARSTGQLRDEASTGCSKKESSVARNSPPTAIRNHPDRLEGQEAARSDKLQLENGSSTKHQKHSMVPLPQGSWADEVLAGDDDKDNDDDDDDDDDGEHSTGLSDIIQADDESSEKHPLVSSDSDDHGSNPHVILGNCDLVTRKTSPWTPTTTASPGTSQWKHQSVPSGPPMSAGPGPLGASPTLRTGNNRVAPAKGGGGRWWVHMPDCCPISKFPVNLLPYPPFRLFKRPNSGCGKKAKNSDVFVDGLLVVLEVISTMNFSVLGKQLSAAEIKSLDYHLKHCKLGSFRLGDALALQRGAESSEEMGQELAQLRARAGQRLAQLRSLQRRRKKRQGLQAPADPADPADPAEPANFSRGRPAPPGVFVRSVQSPTTSFA